MSGLTSGVCSHLPTCRSPIHDDTCPGAPVSAVAGPEPDEGPRTWRCCEHCAPDKPHPENGHARPCPVQFCRGSWLAAPAAAPVGDEDARAAAAAVIRRARYQPAARADRTFDQHLADELHAAGLLAPPGDEGAARAAVARVLALCDAADAGAALWRGVGATGRVGTDDLRAALSAVSGEHREARAYLTASGALAWEHGEHRDVTTPAHACPGTARCALCRAANAGEHREAEDGQ